MPLPDAVVWHVGAAAQDLAGVCGDDADGLDNVAVSDARGAVPGEVGVEPPTPWAFVAQPTRRRVAQTGALATCLAAPAARSRRAASVASRAGLALRRKGFIGVKAKGCARGALPETTFRSLARVHTTHTTL